MSNENRVSLAIPAETITEIKEHFSSGKSIFDNTTLVLDNDIPFISGVEKLRQTMPQYFL